MRSLIHGSSHSATTRGHTLGAPHLCDVVANIFFFGHRRVTFQVLIAAAGVQPGQRVRGVGCGTGYFTRLLGHAVGRDGLIVGIDPSPALISYASRQTGRASNCQFQVGTVDALEFPRRALRRRGVQPHHAPHA
jgi:ubiquinone/menaquinone biosynthesis C-methylase UbiE